ncbi:MAG: type I methionyl aminopeptidase [Firmicutes bacterium]|nr:type I methionyl aminopeptidase [Bacillota bacterium]
MIPIKSQKDIEKMRAVNRLVALTHAEIEKHIAVDVTTKELDKVAHDFIIKHGARPNFYKYRGYPASSCISVNEVVIHGIPSYRTLADGDIVSVDLGAVLDGFHGDMARTYAVGSISNNAKSLIQVTKDCFYEGLKECRAGRRVGDISNAIQKHAEKFGYGVVRQFCGHGIGRRLHEDPAVANFGASGTGTLLKAGYCLAIEPMINEGSFNVTIDSDGWTVRTADGKLSAHYENVVLITNDEPEILTQYKGVKTYDKN